MHIHTHFKKTKKPYLFYISLISNIKLNMAFVSASACFLIIYMVLSEIFCVSFSHAINTCPSGYPEKGVAVDKEDIDKMQFPVNLEFLEAEYFLWATYGHGLDVVAPKLAMGGPPPIGARKANLDPLTKNIITEFANQEVGHLRALNSTVGVFPRPLLDLSAKNFEKLFDEAFGHKLIPPFDPYRDSLSYMLSCYVIPYVGLVGYVGTNPNINGYETKRVKTQFVFPYKHTVAHFTSRISKLRNKLAKCGNKDEGIFVPPQLGAENRTISNVLSADFNSLSYKRTPSEILRIVYNSGNEHLPGGFYPNGANGKIAREFLKQPH
ncbi:ferritin-like catalase Nec2 [Lycium ferocissimum]|uniref:ferritin-like catalase Nec2 n=1 Tax=Lycium ferocissimum TaxID=112874 RepID=UPI002814F491|nr:ferritin-like catalase Nec2 [Lycium ferocissimum]